jgi:hypothetical protein
MIRNLASCALVALLAACGSEPDTEHPSWRYIHAAIVVPNCATSGCHSTLTKTKGIDLQNRDSAYLVIKPNITYLDVVQLMKGEVNNFYRMPPDQPLPDADIDLVAAWVADGAKDN